MMTFSNFVLLNHSEIKFYQLNDFSKLKGEILTTAASGPRSRNSTLQLYQPLSFSVTLVRLRLARPYRWSEESTLSTLSMYSFAM